jgi:hypothetical protein
MFSQATASKTRIIDACDEAGIAMAFTDEVLPPLIGVTNYLLFTFFRVCSM